MYNNDYMYAIERNENYLAHYGIRGMKWGVRKAIASGNSARLSKQYAKAQKKLAKLDKRAAKAGKYAKRAAVMGAGAAAAGTVAGMGVSRVAEGAIRLGSKATKGVASGMTAAGTALQGSKHGKLRSLGTKMKNVAPSVTRASNGLLVDSMTVGHNLKRWENSTGGSKKIGKALENFGDNTLKGARSAASKSSVDVIRNNAGKIGTTSKKAGNTLGKSGVTNGTLARIGAGAIGAGLAIGAAKNAYRAATAKKKADKFRSAMNESFKGTKYENAGGKPRYAKKKNRRRR